METSAAEISVEDSSDKAKDDKDDSTSMDTSELDASKENSLSVSLFVHTDDIQDDLDDDLKEAAAAAASKAAAKTQDKEEEKSVQGDGQEMFMFRIYRTLCQVTRHLKVKSRCEVILILKPFQSFTCLPPIRVQRSVEAYCDNVKVPCSHTC